jgi:hypothetical protein
MNIPGPFMLGRVFCLTFYSPDGLTLQEMLIEE